MNWNQVMCDHCWAARNPTRAPYRLVEQYRKLETCSWCGQLTESGILVRGDPDKVEFPQPDVEPGEAPTRFIRE